MQAKEKIPVSGQEAIVQLIVFLSGKEEFGIPIDMVREIIKIGTITPIPNSPEFIKGIINVRGEIVTTIDIKSRFALQEEKAVESKHIVVTKQDDCLFGLLVDEVIEVLRIQRKDIKPPPSLITQIHQDYVGGVVSHDNRLIIVLDLNQVLSQKELLHLSDFTQKQNDKNKSKKKINK